ncbi:hypothetical protein [Nitratifractor sp.]|uniref:hypothetical protein n=1 Tax=Nitratifractor sp. TaxID=2268144 RepID=UPI0025E94800|nr:hypothetical protein [Nitratifractor sp.]
MQLNEILEEHSLESISERTRIAPQNLEALIHGDWERLRKVQALGFLSILEREYGVDLSPKREECRAYFESHAPNDKAISVTAEEVTHTGKHRFVKVLTLLILLGLAYGSWYLFVEKNRTLESNTTATSQESFYDSVMDMAGGWFKEKETEKNESEQKEAASKPIVQGVWAQKKNGSREGQKKETPSGSGKKTQKNKGLESPAPLSSETDVSSEEKGGAERVNTPSEKVPSEEEKIIAQVKAEQAKKEENEADKAQALTPEEKKAQAEHEISSMISEATEGQKKNVQRSEGETLESIPPSMKKVAASNVISKASTEKKMQTTEPEVSVAGEKRETTKKNPKAKVEKKKMPAGGIVVFHPRSKVWVGYTELRSMKRFAKVTDKEIPFDTSKGDYILAVGHGLVQFRGPKGELLKLNDGGKHFFMIAKGGVREISHAAFQRLNKNKVW